MRIAQILPEATVDELREIARHHTVRALLFTKTPAKNYANVLGIDKVKMKKGRKIVRQGSLQEAWADTPAVKWAINRRRYTVKDDVLEVRL